MSFYVWFKVVAYYLQPLTRMPSCIVYTRTPDENHYVYSLRFLRFLPSLCVVYRAGQPCHWLNMTWVSEPEFTFRHLEPFTWYNITVFVRLDGQSDVFPASQYISQRTDTARTSTDRARGSRLCTG